MKITWSYLPSWNGLFLCTSLYYDCLVRNGNETSVYWCPVTISVQELIVNCRGAEASFNISACHILLTRESPHYSFRASLRGRRVFVRQHTWCLHARIECSQFLSTSALLTPVLAMQAYCKKLMQDEKALAWQCYCKYWWSNQFWLAWLNLAERLNQSQDLISAFLLC